MNGSYETHKVVTFGVDGGESLELENGDLIGVVDSSFVYPTFKSIKEKEVKEIPSKMVFHYKCDSAKCEFPIATLKESTELRSLGIKQTAEIVVDTINSNQQLFTARNCGGYIFQAAGKSLIIIQNGSIEPNDDTRFGFMDLTETRRRFIHQYEISKLRNAQASMNAEPSKSLFPIFVSGAGGSIVGAGALFGVLKLLHKI